MKTFNILTLLLAFALGTHSQIVINEFQPDIDRVEIKNTGPSAVDVSSYRLCTWPDYKALSSLTIESGALMLEPGAFLVVSGHFTDVDNLADNELGLYIDSSFGSSASILDYVEWGSHGHMRSSVAEEAGIWLDGSFLNAPDAGMSVSWDGVSDSISSWSVGAATFGCENTSAGEISTESETTVCTGDGSDDLVIVELSGNTGTNSIFVLTDEDANILDTQTESLFNFEGAGDGICLIWHLSYDDDVDLDVENANDLTGCFSLSNSIAVTRNNPDGGIISTTDVTIVCLADENSGQVTVDTEGVIGGNETFIITDEELNIIAVQEDNVFQFGEAGPGVCLIWHLSYENDVDLNITSADDLAGCFSLSNSITITRNNPDGGFISTGDDTELCTSDENEDLVFVDFEDVEGTNSLFVVTNEALDILDTQTDNEFDFEGTPSGTCLIWHLSYEDDVDLEGVTNTADITGCHDLSNSIEIVRTAPQGGTISTTDNTTVCTGDGEPDLITVVLEGASGPNSLFAITDAELNILGTQTETEFDFDGAGPGVCFIWHVSYEDDTNIEEITNGDDITGCFSASNSIAITRNQPNGGDISTESPTEVCTNDGQPDLVVVDFEGVEGTNGIFVITDTDSNILATSVESTLNFEGTPEGTCLVWHLSYEDDVDLEGVTNTADITGCHDLSNSIEIIRKTPNGGTITTENLTTICADDGVADPVEVTVENVNGANSIFVVTDEALEIIQTQTESTFDFDAAGEGVCLIWHMSYEDDVDLEGVTNAGDITGCFDLSNSIAITRKVGEDCDCLANGGTISTEDDTDVCVGDGTADNVTVSFVGTSGTNSIFVITDESLEIIDTQTDATFNFDGAGEGVCLIWHLSHDEAIDFDVVTNTNDITGCFDLSNSITINRTAAPTAGTISTSDPIEVCTSDGEDDIVTVELAGNEGTNGIFVLTNETLDILDTQEGNEFNFEGAGEGTCLIWHLSYEDNVSLDITNAGMLSGCFALSNSISVVRKAPNGGDISTEDPTTICAGDGEADPITVALAGEVGPNGLWVITDESLNILGTQEENVFDFEGAGAGVCLIWHLSYEDDVDLTDVTNTEDIIGCHNLSNPIAVTRNQPTGGVISTDDFTTICAGDGEDDNVTVDFEGADGTNSLFVITDEDLNIIDTQTSNMFNFEGAGEGICLIWHLSYEDGVDVGVSNAGDLNGCFDLSNSITINRRVGVDCDCLANGGIISTEDPTVICAGNGEDDIVNVSFTNVSGTNSLFVITDTNLDIINTQTETQFNFEGAGAGTCLIWHLSHEDDVDLTGVTNTGDITGCFDLSNSIEIVRNSPQGGEISTTDPTTFCVGDDNPDEVNVSFTDVAGTNSLFVITDTDLEIIATQIESSFEFDGAGVGVCLIWHLSYEDDVDLEGVTNTGDITGCFNLSNSIEVNRENASADAVTVDGSEDSITVIVGDGTADAVTFGNTSSSALSYTYVITSSSDVIIGTTDDTYDFEDETPGTCRVYGVSYSGTLTVTSGNLISSVTSNECFDVSDDFLPVIKDQFIGIGEVDGINALIYPTVVQSELTISGLSQSYDLVIYNGTGQVVFNKNIGNGVSTVVLPNLSKGLYIGKITSSEINQSFRLIKE